jgi:hypothetical protein
MGRGGGTPQDGHRPSMMVNPLVGPSAPSPGARPAGPPSQNAKTFPLPGRYDQSGPGARDRAIKSGGLGRLGAGWGGISLLVAVIPVTNSGLRGELGVVLPRMLPQKILIEAPSHRDPLKIPPKVDVLPQVLPQNKNGVSRFG